MLIGGLVTHLLISSSVADVGSLVEGSQNAVWPLALEDEFRRTMKNAVKQSIRQRLHERGFTSTRFHDFETASKSMWFGSAYTEPFSPENPSRDGISERYTTC